LRECAGAAHAEQERDSAEFGHVFFHMLLVVDLLAVTTHARRSGSVLIAKCLFERTSEPSAPGCHRQWDVKPKTTKAHKGT
jgi:hypothetical protein